MKISQRENAVKPLLLFFNFLLIILSYYQVKPVSRSVILEHMSANQLPYLWIVSAAILGLLMPGYYAIVARIKRQYIAMVSSLLFALMLIAFYFLLQKNSSVSAIGFYLFVDLYSVVLVEQFWSLTNSAFNSQQGRKYYALVSSGGLVGGIIGGLLASFLLRGFGLVSTDLLLVASGLLLLLVAQSFLSIKYNIYPEVSAEQPKAKLSFSGVSLFKQRYIVMITLTLLMAQRIEPIVEYLFMNVVQQNFTVRDERTAYLSSFLSALGVAALIINLTLTPLIHRFFGAVAGLFVQPVAVLCSALVFFMAPSLMMAATLKVSDRGLSYSINRASKELLYIPLSAVVIYQVKAWIDMLGYRLFKLSGAVIVLFFTQWLAFKNAHGFLSIAMLVAVIVWIYAVIQLRKIYPTLVKANAETQG